MDEQLQRLMELRRKNNEERNAKNSMLALRHDISKALETTMIASLVACENKFGFLWGLGKPTHELDEEQLIWRNIWMEIRDEILNKGNEQLHKLYSKLEKYNVKYQSQGMDK